MALKATEILQKAGTFYFATVEGDQPRLRAFGAVAEFDGKTWICMNKTKKVFAQLIANPKCEILAMDGGNWTRIWCKAIHVDTDDARKKMLEANPNLGGMYKYDDGIYAVFALEDVHGKTEGFGGPVEEF